MLAIIDSFEEDYCLIEIDGRIEPVQRALVDHAVKVGDVVDWDGHKWITNRKQTAARSQSIKKLMDDLWED
ncbi:DUF3006 domain-containing protein [Paenibacillus turicensis]|uniref:DUF3006 domain-containing protein n=1 Tax=Paenibacillus turicensis TaxID=160487 RepID=UPI003D2D7217